MDLLQYLIAPHEQQPQAQQDQQPSPVITSIPINHEQSQQHEPTTPVATQDLYHQSQQQDLMRTALYAQAPVSMPLHQRYAAPAYTHSPVSSALYAESSDGSPPVSQHQQYQQPLQPSATPEALDRQQLIQGLAAHPDVLASLLSNGSLAGLYTAMLNPQQPAASANHRTASPVESTRSQISTQVAPPVPIVETRQICFWWYHNGNCTKHPESSNFNGTQDHCRFLHHLTNDNDMINVTQQHFPGHWHRKGDCVLERCRFSSTYRHLSRPFQKQKQEKSKKSQRQFREQSQNWDQQFSQQNHSPASQSDGSGNGQPAMRILTANDAPSAPIQSTPDIPTSPAAGTHGKKQHQYQHHHQQPLPGSPIPTPTLKRKASTLSLPTGPSAKVPKLTKSQRKKLAKDERKTAKLALTTLAAPKHFDIVPCLTSGFPPHTDTPCKKKTQTCFFWYHGTCDKTGPKCHMVHALLPGYVQPPKGYVHRDACTRDWCPGDWMWEHGGEAIERERPRCEVYGQLEEEEDEDDDEDVVMEVHSNTDAELGSDEGEIDELDGEWYIEGIADA